jgi:hypothetical protein
MDFSMKFAIFWNPTHLDSLLRKHLPNPGISYNFPVGFESKNKPTGLRLCYLCLHAPRYVLLGSLHPKGRKGEPYSSCST